MASRFMEVAPAAGLDFDSSMLFYTQPGRLADCVLTSAKQLAKALTRAGLAQGHRQALEHMAKAIKFPDYHALQTLCQHPECRTDFSWIDAFTPALALLIQPAKGAPPTEQQLKTWLGFATALAARLEAPPESVLNCLAQTFAESSWALLCARATVNPEEPLYRFSAARASGPIPAAGVFSTTDLGERLLEELADNPKGGTTQAHILKMLKQHPGLLDARIRLADLLAVEGLGAEARPALSIHLMSLYLSVIGAAEELMPAGFEGVVPCAAGHNRFYHQAMHGAMRVAALNGKLALAIELAEKQLRLNPNDDLGVRFDLPILLAADGQEVAAISALQQASLGESLTDGALKFTESLVYCALGQETKSICAFGQALLFFPVLRHFLGQEAFPPETSPMWREPIPDLEGMWFQLAIVQANAVPWHEMPYRYLLERNSLKELETRAMAAYARESKTETLQRWYAWAVAEVNHLLPVLLDPLGE